MTLYLNEEKTIKPAVFIGAFLTFAAILIFSMAIVMRYGVTTEPFLIVFGVGVTVFLIGFLPGIKLK